MSQDGSQAAAIGDRPRPWETSMRRRPSPARTEDDRGGETGPGLTSRGATGVAGDEAAARTHDRTTDQRQRLGRRRQAVSAGRPAVARAPESGSVDPARRPLVVAALLARRRARSADATSQPRASLVQPEPTPNHRVAQLRLEPETAPSRSSRVDERRRLRADSARSIHSSTAYRHHDQPLPPLPLIP